MPVPTTYPGVYIEEVPSSVRVITGVSTSTTAFIGRAKKGPPNYATTIHSFADFERIFGGLWKESNMSYAVYQYFLNGGTDAVIIRVVPNDAKPVKFETPGCPQGQHWDAEKQKCVEDTVEPPPGNTAEEPPKPPKLTLEAPNPGVWAGDLKITVKDDDINEEIDTTDDPLFNILIENTESPERFYNISSRPNNPRFITTVLKEESNLVRIPSDSPPKEGKIPYPVDTHLVKKESGSDGDRVDPMDIIGSSDKKTGIFALDNIDNFNMLCIPPYNKDEDTPVGVYVGAQEYCKKRRAMLIVDSPSSWDSKEAAKKGINEFTREFARSENAAIFFPAIKTPDPLPPNRLLRFVPCGVVAGVIARIDSQRGIWKAPAGLEASLIGVSDLDVRLTDAENGELNPLGINCLRILPAAGLVVWGSRTMRGADRLADQWKYLPVRRTALFIEESLYQGTQWVVFEPNDEPLWAQIRLNIRAFMHDLFRKGAFQGSSPKEAYLVKCDKETTTQYDIDRGIVNIIVGFAPLKPAEFVMLQIQQLAGQEEKI